MRETSHTKCTSAGKWYKQYSIQYRKKMIRTKLMASDSSELDRLSIQPFGPVSVFSREWHVVDLLKQLVLTSVNPNPIGAPNCRSRLDCRAPVVNIVERPSPDKGAEINNFPISGRMLLSALAKFFVRDLIVAPTVGENAIIRYLSLGEVLELQCMDVQ